MQHIGKNAEGTIAHSAPFVFSHQQLTDAVQRRPATYVYVTLSFHAMSPCPCLSFRHVSGRFDSVRREGERSQEHEEDRVDYYANTNEDVFLSIVIDTP